jgi:hypothetical protein
LDVNNYKGKKFQKYYISKFSEPPFVTKDDIHNKAQEFITNIIPTIISTIIPNTVKYINESEGENSLSITITPLSGGFEAKVVDNKLLEQMQKKAQLKDQKEARLKAIQNLSKKIFMV